MAATQGLADGQQLVFVGGLHRSGTTVLADLLASHPQGSGLSDTGVEEDEGQHLQHVYPVARLYGGPGRFARHPFAHLTETSPAATPANAAAMLRAWTPYWDMAKPFLVEKSPPNLIMGRFLQTMYPDAKFVFIVRHPVPVSLATTKWRKRTPLARLFDHWFVAHDTMLGDLPALRHVHVLKYEDLMGDPHETLKSVASFLGMAGPLDAERLETSYSTKYAAMWQQMLSRDDARAARQALRIVDRFGERARGFGYDLTDLDVVEPFPFPVPEPTVG